MKAADLSRLILGFAIIAALVAAWLGYDRLFGGRPDPETIARASLAGIQEQSRLVPFTARYVAVVTARESRFGLTAQKTLILPGTVRYELDLEKLKADDLHWDADARRLDISLPPIEIGGPEFALGEMREYRDGELVLALTDAEGRLDVANRNAAKRQLIAEARGETPMKLARAASINAMQAAFAMPLRAAGIDAKVAAHFEE